MKNVSIYFSISLLFLFVGLSPVYAGFDKGWYALMTRDYKTALSEFKPLAMQGNALAQKNLGWMYFTGAGVTQDYAEAFKWYKKAAEQGNAEAQNSLGFMYDMGQGVTQDYAEAFKWYKKAAEQEFAEAQGKFGFMYYEGRGVTRDYTMAYMWFNLAAAQGNEGAISFRSIVEKKMTPEQITEAQRLSSEFKVKSP